GIYCVYNCVYDASAKKVELKSSSTSVMSDDVNGRIADQEKLSDWQEHVEQGQVLCYNFGPVPSANRVRCEAAMIFKHKPPENTEYKTAFPFDQTTMTLTGKTALLHTNFTVQRAA
ncbi:MAG: hypothetical protein WB799_08795, partial [Candidatus Sulfotelmatobacter sp.]